MGRAAILGQITTGSPLSPLCALTFIVIGLAEVSLRDHQRHMFGWALGTTLVMTVIATATGGLALVSHSTTRTEQRPSVRHMPALLMHNAH